MLNSWSSAHTGLKSWKGVDLTTWRYLGTSGSFASNSRIRSSRLGAGPSKTATDPMCIGTLRCSAKKNSASSVLIRSITELLGPGAVMAAIPAADQLVLEDLAECVLRQLGAELVNPRALVGGQLSPAVRDEVGLGQFHSCPQDDHRHDFLAEPLIGHADHRR